MSERYIRLLCLTLVGYATMGKGFAYVGIPPLFIGEIVLGLGILVVIWIDRWIAMFGTVTSLLLMALILWVISETIPFIRPYGVDAIRDSIIVVYGLFAFIVIALMLDKPERLGWIIHAYSRFAWLYGLIGGPLFYIVAFAIGPAMPTWPSSGVPMVSLKAGEVATHLAGAATFTLLGFRKITLLWGLGLLVGLGMISVNRGGMTACLVTIGIAAIAGGQLRRVGPPLILGGVLFALTYAVGLNISLPGAERSLGPEQIIDNVESLFGTSQAPGYLEGTKTWRLHWWHTIEDYTLRGPYFWRGKGFGINLAEADGFMVGEEHGGPPLRSPHSSHMTILARSGVPGLTLWVSTGMVWLVMLVRNTIIARRRGDIRWANLFLWIACYGTSIVIDSSFDVALEGPMLGIWFWSLFGLGIASVMIYQATVSGSPRQLAGVAPSNQTVDGLGLAVNEPRE